MKYPAPANNLALETSFQILNLALSWNQFSSIEEFVYFSYYK